MERTCLCNWNRWKASACKTWFEIINNSLYENKDSFPSDIDSSTSSLEKGPSVVNDDNEKWAAMITCDNVVICPIDGESDKKENILNSEDTSTLLTLSKMQIKVLSFKTRAITIITKNIEKLKILLDIRFLDLMIFKTLKLLKELLKYQENLDWYNIKNVNDDTISSIDWKSVDK